MPSQDERWHWDMDRRVKALEDTMEAIRALPTEMALMRQAFEARGSTIRELKEDVERVGQLCESRFNQIDDTQRRSKRDLMLALSAYASPIVVVIVGYLLGIGH